MARDFQIYGEVMVFVKFGFTGDDVSYELGLCHGPVKVTIAPKHQNMKADDYGPDVPPEVMFMLADANIKMTLVHYDPDVLQDCIDESMGGSSDGTLVSAGTIMGGNANRSSPWTNKYHYVQLFLAQIPEFPDNLEDFQYWRFPASYLCEPTPVEVPIGTDRSLVNLNWKAIPYCDIIADVRSKNSILWDRQAP